MALTVKAGGKTFTFPDNTSQADIEEAVNTNVGNTQADYQNYVLQKGRSMGLPDELIYGTLSNESSGGDPRHFIGGKIEGSTERAQGPLQIRPSTAADLGYNKEEVIRDPRVAADAALDYMSQNYKKFKGDISATMKAHFGGPGNAYTDSPSLNSYAERGMAAGKQFVQSLQQQQAAIKQQAGPVETPITTDATGPAIAGYEQPTNLNNISNKVVNAMSSATGLSVSDIQKGLFSPQMLINDRLNAYRDSTNNAVNDNGTYYTPTPEYTPPPAESTAGFRAQDLPTNPDGSLREDLMGKPPIAAAPVNGTVVAGPSGVVDEGNNVVVGNYDSFTPQIQDLGQGIVSGTENFLRNSNDWLNSLPVVGGAFRAMDTFPEVGQRIGQALGTNEVAHKVGQAVGEYYHPNNPLLAEKTANNPAFRGAPIPAPQDQQFGTPYRPEKMVASPTLPASRIAEETTPFVLGMALTPEMPVGAAAGRAGVSAISGTSKAAGEYLASHPGLARVIGGATRGGANLISAAPSNLAGAIGNTERLPGESDADYQFRVAGNFAANEAFGAAADFGLTQVLPRVFSPRSFHLNRMNEEATAARSSWNSVQKTADDLQAAKDAHADAITQAQAQTAPLRQQAQQFNRDAIHARAQGDTALAEDLKFRADAYKQHADNITRQTVEPYRGMVAEAQLAHDTNLNSFNNQFGYMKEDLTNPLTGRGVQMNDRQFNGYVNDLESLAGRNLTNEEKASMRDAMEGGRPFIPEDDLHPYNQFDYANRVRNANPSTGGQSNPLGMLDQLEAATKRAMTMNKNGAQVGLKEILQDPSYSQQMQNFLKRTGLTPDRLEKLASPGAGTKTLAEFFGIKDPELAAKRGKVSRMILNTVEENVSKGYGSNIKEDVLRQHINGGTAGINNTVDATIAGLGDAKKIQSYGQKLKDAIASVKSRNFAHTEDILGNLRNDLANDSQVFYDKHGNTVNVDETGHHIEIDPNTGKERRVLNEQFEALKKIKADIDSIDAYKNFVDRGEALSGLSQNALGTGLAASMMALFHAFSLGTSAAVIGGVLKAKGAVGAARRQGAEDLYHALYGRYTPRGQLAREANRSWEFNTGRSAVLKGNADENNRQDRLNSEAHSRASIMRGQWDAATNPDNLKPIYPEELTGSQLSSIANKMGIDDAQLSDIINSNKLFLRSLRDPKAAKKEIMIDILEAAAATAATSGVAAVAPPVVAATAVGANAARKAVGAYDTVKDTVGKYNENRNARARREARAKKANKPNKANAWTTKQ